MLYIYNQVNNVINLSHGTTLDDIHSSAICMHAFYLPTWKQNELSCVVDLCRTRIKDQGPNLTNYVCLT